MKFEIPDSRKYSISANNIEVKNKQVATFEIRVMELAETTLNIDCDVSGSTIMVNDKPSGKEIKVPPFRDQKVCIIAKGYKWKEQIVKGSELLPGKNKTVKFHMEKLPSLPPVSKQILEADRYFGEGKVLEGKASVAKYAKALKIYEKEEHPHAFYRCGLIFRDRLAGPYFKGDWKKYFRKAAEGGHLEAMYEVGRINQDEGKFSNALFWYKQCEEQNYLPGLAKLGDFYKDGKKEDGKVVVTQDVNRALKYYLKVVQMYDKKDGSVVEVEKAYREVLKNIIDIYEKKFRDAVTDGESSEYRGKLNHYRNMLQRHEKK